jgi:hypothetical protein
MPAAVLVLVLDLAALLVCGWWLVVWQAQT